MKANDFSFFQNRDCCYFPCHETADPDSFNCLFCYCPLYALGKECGGNCIIIAGDIKDCSNCMIPHSENGFGYIVGKFPEIAALEQRNRHWKEEMDK